MKKLIVSIAIVFGTIFCFSQKPNINTALFDKWPAVQQGAISNKGNYIFYTIYNQPLGGNTLVIKSAKDGWQIAVIGGQSAQFSDDNTEVWYMHNDTLVIQKLGKTERVVRPGATSYQLFMQGRKQWATIQEGDKEVQRLTLMELPSHQEKYFPGVIGNTVSPSGSLIVLQSHDKSDKNKQSLFLLDIKTGVKKVIWQGSNSSGVHFDLRETQVAFIGQREVDKNVSHSIIYFSIGSQNVIELVSNQSPELQGLEIGAPYSLRFSNDGQRLFFNLQKPEPVKLDNGGIMLNVWSYKDAKLQSQQTVKPSNETFLSVVNLAEKKIIRLVKDGEVLGGAYAFGPDQDDRYILAARVEGDGNESWWNPLASQTTFLISTITGERTIIKENAKFHLIDLQISPGGNYVTYFDPESKNYYSLNILLKKTTNLTRSIHTDWTLYYLDSSFIHQGFVQKTTGWLKNDAAILVNDRFDIWKLDMTGKVNPVNLTRGSDKNVVHYVAISKNIPIYDKEESILIQSFDLDNKNMGFCSLTLGPRTGMKKLSAGPYQYGEAYSPYTSLGSIIKSEKENIYLVKRQSTTSAPNYFVTSDFKTLKEVSNVHPERHFNWLTSELHNFTLPNGRLSQGVLYKPEDFDSLKKYPVIIHYYMRESEFKCNAYLDLELNGGTINIPHFVSNGYLVFLADMHYEKRKIAESVTECAIAAANHLKQFSFVDAAKMGIHGHSFGGMETNFIVTRTDMFAAAASCAGVSDLISLYGALWGYGNSTQMGLEIGSIGMTGTLWERKDAYIQNSPIMYADQINTPLLMMHNKNDGAVPFTQGVELFTALRRLGKKVWMLEYDGQSHTIEDANMKTDFEIRLKQFFDYYLMDKPAPIWMTRGIPASKKGIDDGLDLDTETANP